MAASYALKVVARRPLTSVAASGLVASCAYANFVEHQANRCADRVAAIGEETSNDSSPIGRLPRCYDRDAIAEYWSNRPVTVAKRVASVAREAGPLLWNYIFDFCLTSAPPSAKDAQALQRAHASNLRDALTHLGPAFVKAGQQLSIRPDLVPPPVIAELQRLCDDVEPVDDEVAMRVLEQELGFRNRKEMDEAFGGIRLVASASLGQVYKATLKRTGREVAIKVQRPDMAERLSLDLFLLNQYGMFMDSVCSIFTEQIPYHVNFLDCFSRGSYSELDYENEALNQIKFKTELQRRKCDVHVPSVYNEFTGRRVLTTEWVDGVKLAAAPKDQLRLLIPVGVELFLTQLLDMGSFHADPHPGNLYVTNDGQLCLLDFGLCADIDPRSRKAMSAAIVNLIRGDFETLISRDAKELGFLPDDHDVTELQPILTKILSEGLLESGSSFHERKKKLGDISNELSEVFFRHPFSVPPFFALITRGLGLLEGIALSGDPEFDIFKASYPYAKKRAAEMFGYRGLGQTLRRQRTSVRS